jgi:TRAP-type C4-dicarboxylate transport system substrate-binding protein
VTATITPFNRSGVRTQDMLQLIRLGVAPFGTVLLSVTEADDPELNGADLAGLNPDFETVKTRVAATRTRLRDLLSQRYGVRLLAVYAYPAQVLFCAKPFGELQDLKGRTVRTSSVSQSDLFEALGAITIVTPFSEVVSAVEKGVVDCAVTGTLSGNENGLAKVTSYLSPMAISWGLSVFAANETAWSALPEDVRTAIEAGLSGLEARIWASADADTLRGLQCNTGAEACPPSLRRSMKAIPITPEDEILRRSILRSVVLPRWIQRCGDDCSATVKLIAGAESDVPASPATDAAQSR